MSDIKRPGLLDDTSPRPSARPSLTGGSVSPAPSGEAVSILSAVAADEPRAAPVKGPVRSGLAVALPWIGVAMLGLIGIAFWLEWNSTHRQAAPVVAAAPPPASAAAPPAMAAAPAPTPPPAAAPSTPEPPPVARIESEPETAPLQPAPASAVAAAAAPTTVAAAAQPSPATPAPPKTKPPKSAAPAAKTAVAQRSPFAAMDEPEPAPRKVKPPPSSGNRDVDLLAALLSGGTARPPTASNAPRSKFSTKLSSMEPGLPATKAEPTPSTRERLSLCNLVAAREAAACRAKVCKGLWGQDAACPAASQPPVRPKQD